MYLDPRTIIIVNIVGSLLMSAGLYLVSRTYLTQMNSIRRWAIASLWHCLGWVLYALRGNAPDVVTIILAQAILLFSLAQYFNILAHFTRRKVSPYFAYTVVLLATLGLAYFLFLVPNVFGRIVVMSVASALLMFACAYVLVKKAGKIPASYQLTAAMFAVPAGIILGRVGYYLFADNWQNINVLAQGTVQSITFLNSYVAAVIITYGFLLMSNDRYIEENKRAEEQVKKSERSLNDAQKLAKVGSWEFDLNTGELKWSKEQYHIFEMEETPSDQLFELCRQKIHPDDLAAMDNAIEIGRQTGKGVIYEHRVICKDGSIKYLLGMGEVYRGEDGTENILRGTVQDITESKRAEETAKKYAILQAKSKEMEQFAYIASHDLREPLLTIKNYAELFGEEYENKLDEDSADYLRRITSAANRMDELMKGLLDYSRLSKVKELQRVDSDELMNHTLADLHSLITHSGARIIVSKLPVVMAYPLELKQLFQNLLSNAIKFTARGVLPEIHVSALKENGVWTFKFEDNGIGIAEKDKDKIFDLFQRLNDRKEYAGSGIGLAYCKKIVELHHGTIWVDSRLEGGSAFYFTIAT
jgi:signal transduction histidine kinase